MSDEVNAFLDNFRDNYHNDLIITSLWTRAPSAREAEEFPPQLSDVNYEYQIHALTPEQVRILLKAGLIYFCEESTRNVLNTEAQAAVYHPTLSLDEVLDPEAYLQALVTISQRA